MQLHHAIDRIHAAGAELHVIGNGAPMFIAGFRDTTAFPGPIYTDPSLAVYEAAQLVRGITTTFNPRAALGALRALRGGFRQGRTQGDPFQQGGVLVVAPSGEILFHHISKAAGDHPKLERVLAALPSPRPAA